MTASLLTSALEGDIAASHGGVPGEARLIARHLRGVRAVRAEASTQCGTARLDDAVLLLLAASAALVVPAGMLLVAGRGAASSPGLTALLRHFRRTPPTPRLAVQRQSLHVRWPRPR